MSGPWVFPWCWDLEAVYLSIGTGVGIKVTLRVGRRVRRFLWGFAVVV